MDSMDAEQIYYNFHLYASGTLGLSAAQQLAKNYEDRAVAIQQIINGIQSGWKGMAGEPALQGLGPFGENALNIHQRWAVVKKSCPARSTASKTAVHEVRSAPPAPTMQNVAPASGYHDRR